MNYPITVYRFGSVPLKAPGKSGGQNKGNAPVNFISEDDDFSFDEDFSDDNFDDEGDDFSDDNFSQDED